jgi:hypothetical protein
LPLNGSTPAATHCDSCVVEFLSRSLLNPLTYNQNFDIGGPIYLPIRNVAGFCQSKNLKRWIILFL